MKQKVFVFFIGCFFLLFGFAHADFESEVVDLVNSEREAEGLHPLSYDPQLADAARDHSEDMGLQDYFSHDNPDGRQFLDRIRDAGYSCSYCGENIASGYPNPEAVISGWMSSPGHRANILDPNFCDIGVGYVYVPGSTYGHYWTQDFGRKEGISLCPSVPVYTISANAGPGGSISPEGSVTVIRGDSLTFTITPDNGYSVQDVIVDDNSKDIVLSYTFSKIDCNHAILVNFLPNTSPPIADSGSGQVVEIGDTVTLDGSQSSDPNDSIVTYEWVQSSGPLATLSEENAVKPTFVATPAMVNSTLRFQLTVYDSGGLSDSDSLQLTILDNNITGFPADVITFYSITNKVVGIKVESGGVLTSLESMDPYSDCISDRVGMPQNMIYGLIDFKIKVNDLGNAAVITIFLPEGAPHTCRWYKYSFYDGWYDYSENITLNPARDQVRLTLVDGGIGDDDGEQNGFINDPSGLGTAPSTSVATDSSGGGKGCFIDSAACGSLTKPLVAVELLNACILIFVHFLKRYVLKVKRTPSQAVVTLRYRATRTAGSGRDF